MTHPNPWPTTLTAPCPCCKRDVALDRHGRFIGHGGGDCACPDFLCQHSHQLPPEAKT